MILRDEGCTYGPSLVSTEEQAKHGLSIDAQISDLRKWAKENGHTVIAEYVDAGISGKKPYTKRPALSRFMEDIEAGKNVDALVFTKLDRFYRSVKLYYQAMEIMDRHKVAWIAIQEDYETVTASGRFKVNIMLSVAENEADRTSERIKAVFEHKVDKGECINPNGLPLGYSMDGKRIAPNEQSEAVKAAFEHYAVHGTKMGVRNMLHERYDICLPIGSIDKMLRNPLYKGQYRENPEFCEPIVPEELFNRVQTDLASRATRKTPSGRIYLFSGLIVCKDCGRRMCSVHTGPGRDYYRCSGYGMYHTCKNGSYVRETNIEKYLLEYISEEIKKLKEEFSSSVKTKPRVNKSTAKAKLERLKELYIEGDISKEKYKTERDKLTAQLEEPPAPKPEKHLALMGENFTQDYDSFDRGQKKIFWRNVLEHIEIDIYGKFYIFLR